MGRYVYGDFDYKFSFAEQDSSLGEILENLSYDERNFFYVKRYIETQGNGEICQVHIENLEEFKEFIENEFLKDIPDNYEEVKSKKDRNLLSEYHDKIMMKLFLSNILENDLDYLNLEIEY